jgi:hypothetical protein
MAAKMFAPLFSEVTDLEKFYPNGVFGLNFPVSLKTKIDKIVTGNDSFQIRTCHSSWQLSQPWSVIYYTLFMEDW